MLVMADRERVGREASPSAVVLDSQSVKTTESGRPRGGACPWASRRLDPRDAGKKVKGRKRQRGEKSSGSLGRPHSGQAGPAHTFDRAGLRLQPHPAIIVGLIPDDSWLPDAVLHHGRPDETIEER